ncbi:glycosyltransferase family 4 protein (plasmid) [Halobacterium sp. MBLA0001]|uniref:glycosyltransferase family 4 protein n=1 Tax=Halobacterium sp. MBLA0001 TaxID=3413511 RepID=UPI003C76FAF6
MTTSALPQQGHRDGFRAETIPEEVQLALAEGAYLPDWSPATRQCRNSLGLNTYAESIDADIVSVSSTGPHTAKSFYQEFARGYSIGKYDTVIAEGSRPLYTGLIHRLIYGSNLVYLCADHRLYELWNSSVNVDSAYDFFKYVLGEYGKPVVRTIAQRGVDGIIAVSEFVKEYLRPIFGDAVPIRVAHPYIQPDLYDRLSSIEPNFGQKKAVTVGRPTYYKGVDLLVDAWPAVREQHPSAELHIVGKGHPESFAETAGVTVRGFVEDLVEVYANAELYVQPSRIEPFGVAVLEALRAGVPPVVTESTGSRSEIKEINDRLIASTTTDGLRKVINWYFDCSRAKKEGLSSASKRRGEKFESEFRKKLFRQELQSSVPHKASGAN